MRLWIVTYEIKKKKFWEKSLWYKERQTATTTCNRINAFWSCSSSKWLQNPIITLQRLTYTSPYIKSIHSIGLDDFFTHIFTPELQLTEEYSCFFGLDVEFSMDRTGSLVDELAVHPAISLGHIFGTEVIIRFDKGVLASVGLLISVS